MFQLLAHRTSVADTWCLAHMPSALPLSLGALPAGHSPAGQTCWVLTAPSWEAVPNPSWGHILDLPRPSGGLTLRLHTCTVYWLPEPQHDQAPVAHGGHLLDDMSSLCPFPCFTSMLPSTFSQDPLPNKLFTLETLS